MPIVTQTTGPLYLLTLITLMAVCFAAVEGGRGGAAGRGVLSEYWKDIFSIIYYMH